MRLSNNDEWYTPFEIVDQFMRLFNFDSRTIWFPFDMDTSNFVRYAKMNNINYVNTHIDMGFDFLDFERPPYCHAIISNPPYSKKYEVLKKLIEFDEPFAMLMSTGIFNNGKCLELLNNPNIRFIFLKKRVKFEGSTSTPPFNSVWVLYRMYYDKRVI